MKHHLLTLFLSIATLGGVTSSEVALWLALTGDLVSTEVALHNGLSEGNPLQRNRAVRISSHIAFGVFMSWQYRKHNKDPKILMIPTIVFTAATGWNVGVTLVHTW